MLKLAALLLLQVPKLTGRVLAHQLLAKLLQ